MRSLAPTPLTTVPAASGQLPQGASQLISEFSNMDGEKQRAFLEGDDKADTLIQSLFMIVERIQSDKEITRWALALINGIVEDRRTRIKKIVALQKSRNRDRQTDCAGILMSFLN